MYLQKPVILPFLLVASLDWSCFHNFITAYSIYFGTFLTCGSSVLIFCALPCSSHFGSVRYSLFICTGLLPHQLDFLHNRIAVALGDCHSDFKFLSFTGATAKDTLSLHIPSHYSFICEKETLWSIQVPSLKSGYAHAPRWALCVEVEQWVLKTSKESWMVLPLHTCDSLYWLTVHPANGAYCL